MQIDKQSVLTVNAVDTISITAASAPYEVAGTEIDTQGARSVTFAIVADEAIGTDVISLKIYECDTSGGTFTAIDSSKYLTGSGGTTFGDKDGTTNAIKTVGCFGTKRYIKPYADADTVADDLTVSVIPIIEFDVKPADVDTLDSLP